MEKQHYTILTGESYSVMATSEDEAFAKFFVLQGFEDEADYADKGFDFSNPDDVTYNETLTEII